MRLSFYMWPYRRYPNGKVDGYMSQFTDGNGVSTDSWWSSPPSSIDHVGPEYLPNRHPNVKNKRHDEFIKRRFKEEVARLKAEGLQVD